MTLSFGSKSCLHVAEVSIALHDLSRQVIKGMTQAGITPASAEVSWVPQNYIKLTGQTAQHITGHRRRV